MFSYDDILFFLKSQDASDVENLMHQADEIRRTYVGDEVHLRAIVEISNLCVRNCLYCGLRKGHHIARYRMDEKAILSVAEQIAALGFRTIVLQSGEDPSWKAEEIARIIDRIRTRFSLVVTLSLGERTEKDYRLWFSAGAQRYLLKHETSDSKLYKRLHPDLDFENRLHCLAVLKDIGYQTGSGIMVGLPGQTLESLANDVLLFRKMDVDMIGIGPFVPNPATPAPKLFQKYPFLFDSEELTYRLIALTRIVTKDAHIPSTTALATMNSEMGWALGLICGANVVMPNATPHPFRELYEIYPKNSGTFGTLWQQRKQIEELVKGLGRHIATDAGHRIKRSSAIG